MEMKAANMLDNKVELEDNFILRLPSDEAKYLRHLLREKPKKIKKNLSVYLNEDLRSAVVYLKKKQMPGKVVDLPTIIEVSKTVNNVNIYKTATISQMLLCESGKPEKHKEQNEAEPNHQYPHGITPPMKNVRKQKFRKTIRNHIDIKEAADVQKEVSLLLRTDNEAVSVKYEVSRCDKEETEARVTEDMLFGPMSSDTEVKFSLLNLDCGGSNNEKPSWETPCSYCTN